MAGRRVRRRRSDRLDLCGTSPVASLMRECARTSMVTDASGSAPVAVNQRVQLAKLGPNASKHEVTVIGQQTLWFFGQLRQIADDF